MWKDQGYGHCEPRGVKLENKTAKTGTYWYYHLLHGKLRHLAQSVHKLDDFTSSKDGCLNGMKRQIEPIGHQKEFK